MREDIVSDSMIVQLQFYIYEPLGKIPLNIIVDDVKYSDDGRGNDERSGDGIYSSIKKFRTTFDNRSYVHSSSGFEYHEDLEEDISMLPGLAIGCDIGTAECVETSWYNTCWPMSSPCTCVTFSNCYAELSFLSSGL